MNTTRNLLSFEAETATLTASALKGGEISVVPRWGVGLIIRSRSDSARLHLLFQALRRAMSGHLKRPRDSNQLGEFHRQSRSS
jgi:hypothetical protein